MPERITWVVEAKDNSCQTLKIRTLGEFELCRGDTALSLPATIKACSLLAYLVLHRDRACPREQLADLLWPDRSRDKALHSLSTALWHIRRVIPLGNHILADAQTVQFNRESDYWLDVGEFLALCSSSPSRISENADLLVERLERAVALYRGDFMECFYDDWCLEERYRLEGFYLEGLQRLVAVHEALNRPVDALHCAGLLLARDPLREEAHRLAMRAYCRLGQRNAALEQYRRCQEIVSKELGAEPMVETTELYRAILEGRLAVGRAPDVPAVQMQAGEPSISWGRSPLDVMSPYRLVGRGQELEFLHQCWREAEAGQGKLVFVSGETGVGKSRLVEELGNNLRRKGVHVLLGRCYEFERVLPFQPIAEALRATLATLAPTVLADLPSLVLAELAQLIPEVLEKQPTLAIMPAISPDQEQARLFDSIAHLLAKLSSDEAILVVLEDLHWASESTLQLIHYLARHLADRPVLIVGIFRLEEIGPQHPLPVLQTRLCQEGLAESLCLSRLSSEATQALVVEMSGAGQEMLPLAGRLYQETEGNPFFLMQIVKALFESGVIHLESGAWRGDFAQISLGEIPLPTSVSQVIEARVHGLNDSSQEALRLAAVLGREFDYDLLAAIWGRGEEAMLEALDDLLRHRLIDEGSGVIGRDYVFTHHKIQEVVHAGMPRRRRYQAHARVGAAMERLYDAAEMDTLTGELAFHFEQGRRHDKALTEKAIAYLLRAGDRARGLYAHQEAIDYYQRALALLKEQGEYERAGRTLMKLGLTYHAAFDFQQAREAYEKGFALWQRVGKTQSTALPPAPHAFRVDWRDPSTLDPTKAWDTPSAGVIDQLFSGLLELSPGMEVVPAIARTWEISDGGRKYVFYLRDDMRWTDRVPVTAGDFEYAWKRALDPATKSPGADKLFDIKGARAFHQGETSDPDRVGVHAQDAVTLVVELEEPTSYFLHLLAHHGSYPVPRHVVQAHGATWAEPENIVTNGPFKLESWQRGKSMALSRDPEYQGRRTGNVQRLELALLSDWKAKLEMYGAGELDIFNLWRSRPSEMDAARRQHSGDYITGPSLVTMYLGFNVRQPPFDDLRVRRAFVHALDRETLADVTMQGYVSPATGGLVPPGMPGHSPGISLRHDPDQAQHLLAEAGYPGGRGFPGIDLLTSLGGESRSERMQAQWLETLGIQVSIQSMEFGTLLEKVDQGTPRLFRNGWEADYPDPDDFLRVCPARRFTGWQNKAYTELIESARQITDQVERMRRYQQADKLLIEEAAVMPVSYSRQHWLVKPWVVKFFLPAMQVRFWKDVIIEPH
jgi:oligopeptide transport system substrate-binding protein